MKAPAPVAMWAFVINGSRSSWIHTGTVARTRSGSRALYIAQFEAHYHREALTRGTFQRVAITVQPKA